MNHEPSAELPPPVPSDSSADADGRPEQCRPGGVVNTPDQRSYRGRPSYGAALLVGAAIVLSTVQRPTIGPNLAGVDVLLFPVLVLGAASAVSHASHAARALRLAAPWLWLVLVGSLLPLYEVGLALWAVDTLARDTAAFLAFFAAWQLLERHPRAIRLSHGLTVWAVLLVAGSILLTDQAIRPSGTFANPNYAAHFLALAIPFVVAAPINHVGRFATLGGLGVALVATGSFVGWAMALAAVVWFVFRLTARATGASNGRAKLLRATLVLSFVAFLITGTATFRDDVVSYATSGDDFTSARLESSSTTRFGLWSGALRLAGSHPLGVGPDGMVHREGLGVLPNRSAAPHNDFLGYFIERGVLGFVGLLGFVSRLWKLSLPDGIARVALVQCGVGAFFHDTLHYRHLWLLLALAYAADRRRAAHHRDDRGHRHPATSRL